MSKEYTVGVVGEAKNGGTMVAVTLSDQTPLPGAQLTAVFRQYGDRFFAPGGFTGINIPRELWYKTLGGLAIEADRKLKAGETTGFTPQAKIPYAEVTAPGIRVMAMAAKSNPNTTIVLWELTASLFTGMSGQLVISTDAGTGQRVFRGIAATKDAVRIFGNHFNYGQSVRAVAMEYDREGKTYKLPEQPNAEYLYRVRSKEDARAIYISLMLQEEIAEHLAKASQAA